MKKSDIGMITIIYIIVAGFFAMTLAFPEEARIYPMIIMAILVVLNTIYLIGHLKAYSKSKVIENDIKEIFEGFEKNQFFVTLLLCIAYVALIKVIGFYVTTSLYILITLLFFKVKKQYILITLVCFMLVIYGTFTLFLNVPLPAGLLI